MRAAPSSSPDRIARMADGVGCSAARQPPGPVGGDASNGGPSSATCSPGSAPIFFVRKLKPGRADQQRRWRPAQRLGPVLAVSLDKQGRCRHGDPDGTRMRPVFRGQPVLDDARHSEALLQQRQFGHDEVRCTRVAVAGARGSVEHANGRRSWLLYCTPVTRSHWRHR